MAGDRARDLTFSILSDTDRLNLVKPAEDMEQLGDSAVRAGTELGKLDTELDDLGRAADDAARDLGRLDDAAKLRDVEQLGDDAKTTARKVDDAFDLMARSSKRGARQLDDSADRMGDKLRDVRDEAGDTAREMGASFDGSADSVFDAMQELAGNAGVAFGPVGLAAGAAAAVGVGLIRAEGEKLNEMAADLVSEMTEAGGKLSDAAIDARIQAAAAEDPAAMAKQKRIVDSLGISWRDFARAKYGDAEAAKAVTQQLADANAKLTEQAEAAGSASGAMYTQQTQLNELAGEIGDTAAAYDIASAAMGAASGATTVVADAAKTAGGSWDDLRGSMVDPITGEVRVRAPGAGEYSRIRSAIQRGIGVIPVSLQVKGQNVFTNNANNSRYRD